jgi:predicted DNA-binding transcriptional regulator AlpA
MTNPPRLLRLAQIIGHPARGIEPIIPVSKTTWYAGIKTGRYPAPVKLGPGISGTSAWRESDIRALVEGA